MSAKYTGGCLCGKVRYATDADPLFSGNCHCKDCQRTSGGPYTPAMLFPKAAMTITGTPKFFDTKADSGRTIARGFCADCGSQLFSRLEFMPDIIGIKAGTLDDAALYKPVMDIWTASAAPWDEMNAEIPKHPASPQ